VTDSRLSRDSIGYVERFMTDPVQQASKASMFRGYVDVLRRDRLLDRVRARVSADVAHMLDQPPPASAWIPWRQTDEVMLAIEAVGGIATVRNVSRDAVLVGLVPVLRVAVEGFLRLFGATPSTLLTRMGQLTSNSSRGVEYEYVATSDRSGEMLVRYPSRRDMPLALFAAAAGGFEAVYELCRVRGTVSDPEILADGMRNAVRLRFRWEPRS
jgi:hypothetical protein